MRTHQSLRRAVCAVLSAAVLGGSAAAIAVYAAAPSATAVHVAGTVDPGGISWTGG